MLMKLLANLGISTSSPLRFQNEEAQTKATLESSVEATKATVDANNKDFSVFWDLENVQTPKGMEYSEAIKRLQRFIKQRWSLASGSIIGVGKLRKESDSMEATRIDNCYVDFTHIDDPRKNSADVALLGEIAKLMYHQKPPHTIFLITGDSDFANILEILTSLEYDVYLISRSASNGLMKTQLAKECFSWMDIMEDWEPLANENDALHDILTGDHQLSQPLDPIDRFRSKIVGLIPRLSREMGIRQETFFRKGGRRALNSFMHEAERIICEIDPNLMKRKKYECENQAKLSNLIYSDILSIMARNMNLKPATMKPDPPRITHSLRLYMLAHQRIEKNLGIPRGNPPPFFQSRQLHQQIPLPLGFMKYNYKYNVSQMVKPLVFKRRF